MFVIHYKLGLFFLQFRCCDVADDPVISKPSRNKSLVRINNHDTERFSVLDRTTSAYFRRSSSSNGRSHGSFGRSNRDRDWEKDMYVSRDKEKSILGDQRSREYSNPVLNLLPKELSRSHSMVTGKQGQTWPRKVPADSSNARKSNPNNTNGMLVHKGAFEKDFPSLGAEERLSAPEIRRLSSPALSTAIQSLPVSPSAVLGGDGWTSALAEVPVIVGSNDTVGSVQQATSPTSASLASCMVTGLNMAETVVQGSSLARTSTPEVGLWDPCCLFLQLNFTDSYFMIFLQIVVVWWKSEAGRAGYQTI